MNVIMLDIDGVLATTKTIFSLNKSKDWIKKYDCYPFDKRCVDVLNEITDNVEAEIVISSNWQRFFLMEELIDIFKINKVKKQPFDITNEQRTSNTSSSMTVRVSSIKKYVKDHSTINKYVVVDDMQMNKFFSKKTFIHCADARYGISEIGIKDKIILSLNY